MAASAHRKVNFHCYSTAFCCCLTWQIRSVAGLIYLLFFFNFNDSLQLFSHFYEYCDCNADNLLSEVMFRQHSTAEMDSREHQLRMMFQSLSTSVDHEDYNRIWADFGIHWMTMCRSAMWENRISVARSCRMDDMDAASLVDSGRVVKLDELDTMALADGKMDRDYCRIHWSLMAWMSLVMELRR